MQKKLIIIPAYNEAGNLMALYREVRETASDFDVIVINDGSLDGTLQLCRENGIPVLDLAVNLGIGGAMQTGYRYAFLHGYDVAVQVDGDGQHDPKYLHTMLEVLRSENADLVIGSRFMEGEGYQSTVLRRWGIRYLSGIIRLLTAAFISDPTSGFRMVNRKLIEAFAADYPQDYPEPESIVRLLREGRRVIEIPVMMRNRSCGSSSIGISASVYYLVKVTAAILLERMQRK